jgi:branched-subunit amino acid aminotransferase/4-amino-4-deoxychorismate lyase
MVFRPEDFLVSGQRATVPISISIHAGYGRPAGISLYDSQSYFLYSATLGGFFPIDYASIHLLAHSLHYGVGAFEGLHMKTGPKGSGLDSPMDNAVRLIYSAETIQPEYLSRLVNASLRGLTLNSERVTPGRWYAINRKPGFHFWDAVSDSVNPRELSFTHSLDVAFAAFDKSRELHRILLDPETLVSIFFSLAFYNRLISTTDFPDKTRKVEGGYYRPLIYFGNAFEFDSLRQLKIPSIGRTMEFSVLNLPWKDYLKAEDYETGLTVLVAPYERIGEDMANGKVTGCYHNSNRNIAAMMLVANAAKQMLSERTFTETEQKLNTLASLGEVLVKTRDGRFVEGSAENLFFIIKNGNTYEVMTPPVSDRPLPGTNRSRAIETFESMGMDVKYDSISQEELARLAESGKLVGMLFTGTGADIIHIKQIVDLPHLKTLAKMTEFASEDSTEITRSPPLIQDMKIILINGGKRHQIIGEILETHKKRCLDELFVPAWNIDFEKLADAMGLELKDVARVPVHRCFVENDYFKEPFKSKEDAQAKYRVCAHLLANAINAQWRKCRMPKREMERIQKAMRS